MMDTTMTTTYSNTMADKFHEWWNAFRQKVCQCQTELNALRALLPTDKLAKYISAANIHANDAPTNKDLEQAIGEQPLVGWLSYHVTGFAQYSGNDKMTNKQSEDIARSLMAQTNMSVREWMQFFALLRNGDLGACNAYNGIAYMQALKKYKTDFRGAYIQRNGGNGADGTRRRAEGLQGLIEYYDRQMANGQGFSPLFKKYFIDENIELQEALRARCHTVNNQ